MRTLGVNGLINVNRKTIVIGDFNAHSQKWGYKDRNLAGDAVEDFLGSNNLELVFDKQDKPTFLHYSGVSSNPDLLMVSTDIIDTTHRTVIEDSGSGHRMVMANIDLTMYRASRPCNRVSWNFRKANWPAFEDFLENRLDESKINFNQHPGKIVNDVNSIINDAARRFIPRGRQVFRSFWNDNLTELKRERDKLRDKAQDTQDPQAVIEWRRSSAILKREINGAKRAAFGEFISKVNYKTEARKTYRFINRLCSKSCKTVKEPMKLNNKILSNDDQISNAFASFFASKQRKTDYMKQRDKLAKRYNVLARTIDDSAEDLCNRNFTEFELELAISQMKPGKSPGPDLIFAEFVHHTGKKARYTLLRLFNKIWNETDGVPSMWKKATIVLC